MRDVPVWRHRLLVASFGADCGPPERRMSQDFQPPPPPWADTRHDLAEDPVAAAIHAIAVELGARGYTPLHQLPAPADDLPPQVVAWVGVRDLLNIRIEHGSCGRLVCRAKRIDPTRPQESDGESVPLAPDGPLCAPDIVRAALCAVGLQPDLRR
ncbi:hypothetical protein [Streptomyces sp. NBC_00470]|uniref:hypothetical protein n=1 Tax=Streptomyces sp. NBC_00470 TaxID=2975753 RepID=UPI002F90D7F0